MLDNYNANDNIVTSNEDVSNKEDEVNSENESEQSVSTDVSLEDLFSELETEIQQAEMRNELDRLSKEYENEAQPELQNSQENDPFFSQDPNAVNRQIEELSYYADAYAKQNQELANQLTSLQSEISTYEKEVDEARNTVNEVNELWEELMSHEILGPLVTKFVNNEEINLAEPVLRALKNESSVMEDFSYQASSPEQPKGKPSLSDMMRSAKV